MDKDMEQVEDNAVLVDTSKDESLVTGEAMGEANHASNTADIYNYNSQLGKDYDESVNTSSTTKGAVVSGSTDSTKNMEDQYKATPDGEYSWNNLAKNMAQTTYDQEESQARYESIEAMQAIKSAATTAFNSYFSQKYADNQTEDKMGWTGGQKQAKDLAYEFLKASNSSNMYTQSELQKYGVETKLGTAKLYAESNMKTLALDYYQDALQQSISEAELTGYYIEPEASELMKQSSVAKNIIGDATSTAEDKQRAQSVEEASNAYFDKLGFSRDANGNYIGVETLSRLNYLETIRSNQVNEELTRQSNEIAKEANSIGWANVELQEKQLAQTVTLANNSVVATMAESPNLSSTGAPSYVSMGVDATGVKSMTAVAKTQNGAKALGLTGYTNLYTISGKQYVWNAKDNCYYGVSGKTVDKNIIVKAS